MIYEDRGCAFAVVFSAVVAEDLWGEEEEALNFKRLLLRPHPAHLRCARSVYRFLDATSWRVPRSGQEGRQDVPSWISLPVPLFKDHQEKDIYAFMHHSPLCHHARQAKKEKVFSFSVGAGASTARFDGRRRKQNRFC